LSEPAKVRPEARVLTYKLGGTAALPARQPEPAAFTPEPKKVARGRDLYNAHCGMCHGPNAIAGSVLPDLRYMSAEKHGIFAGILAGAYAQKGMPSFMDVLAAEDVDSIHHYLVKRAQDLQGELAVAADKIEPPRP